MIASEIVEQDKRIAKGWTCYAVGFTIILMALLQLLTIIWLPLFGCLAIVGSGFAAEGAVRHDKPGWAMGLILGGAATPLILMIGGLLWNGFASLPSSSLFSILLHFS